MRSRQNTALTASVILFGGVLLPLAMSGASVAIPTIGADLHVDGHAASWVVTGYFLAASSLMLVSGALGDNVGRRRVYRIGAAVYSGGALAASAAPTVTLLLVGRVIAGAGAAAILAAGAATSAAAFHGAARNRMFAAFGTAAATGLAAGPVASGGLVEALGWRGAFAIFAAGGLVLLIGSGALPESRRDEPVPIDWIGAGLVIAALGFFMLGVAGAPDRGWTHPLTLVSAAALTLSIIGLVLSARRAAVPIIDFGLLRNSVFAGWLLALAAVSIGYAGLLAHLPSYLQSIRALTPSQSGMILLTPVVPMILLPILVGHISAMIPARLLIGPALLSMAVGNGWLALVISAETPIWQLLAPLLVIGVGLGIATGVVDAQAMNEVTPEKHGLAAGMVNTVRGMSTTLTMALFGTALVGVITLRTGDSGLAGQLASGAVSGMNHWRERAVADAWVAVELGLAATCAACAVAVIVLLRPQRQSERRKSEPQATVRVQ